MKVYIWLALLFAVVLGIVAVNVSNDHKRAPGPVIVWSEESEPDRIQGLKDNLAIFTQRTGIKTQVLPIAEDRLSSAVVHTLATGKRPDVVAGISARLALNYGRDNYLDTKAANSVIEHLGIDTFLPSALQRLQIPGEDEAAVPSDGWGQLLYYRKDLFRKAKLKPPRTIEDVIRDAQILDRPRLFRRGMAIASAGDELFTEQSFESVALAYNCQVVDRSGKVVIDSPECVRAFRAYLKLVHLSFGQGQTVEATRETYFAGQSAMLFWSPFILDALAGLQPNEKPTCDQCLRDINFLARNTGIVSALGSPNVSPAHYGSVVAFGIVSGDNEDAAKLVVEYLMSDGYARWLALNPAGKYPMRTGTRQNPHIYQLAWRRLMLEGTGNNKPPLGDFYNRGMIDAVGNGALTFTAWGFPQGQGPLVGALAVSLPVPLAIDDLLNGAPLHKTLKALKHQIEQQQAQG